MTTRRSVLRAVALAPLTAALAACATGGSGTIPPIPVNINLPPEVLKFLTGVNAVLAKLQASGVTSAAADLIAQAKAYIAKVEANPPDLKTWVGYLGTIMGALSSFLPPPYNLAASALAGIMSAYAGVAPAKARGMAAAPTMSLDEALQILEH